MTSAWRLPRQLHPAAWWLWALCLATVASRTTNPLLLGLVAAVAGFVVAARRPATPWGRSYAAFLRLGLLVLAVRMLIEIVFGVTGTGTVVFTLPEVPLPDWMAGVSIGGPVTTDELVLAFYQGLQLAVLLACIGAANALASPMRLLKLMPGALYEAGVAVTVALSFAPQAVASLKRIRDARRLRGRPTRGLRSWRGLALPVLEDALVHSIALAAAMDARGFGRRGDVSDRTRRLTVTLTLGGLLAIAAGSYGLLTTDAPRALGLPLLAVGAAVAAAGLAVGGRRSGRTRYRPDVWSVAEWLVAATGITALVTVAVTGQVDPLAINPTTSPLVMPPLPVLPTVGVLLAMLPAWAAPEQQTVAVAA
jgi:energy-coupling factor transport system permease protein